MSAIDLSGLRELNEAREKYLLQEAKRELFEALRNLYECGDDVAILEAEQALAKHGDGQ